MTPRHTTFPLTDGGAATLTLPPHITLADISRLEHDLGRLVRMLRKDFGDRAGSDPGAIEFDSWAAQTH